MQPGVYLIHKPVGPSSFAVMREFVSAQGALAGTKIKACHGGTLDPFASGLLIVLVGQATKLFDYLHDVPKVYEAVVRWGVETDNGDPLGGPIFTGDPSALSKAQLKTALGEFVGWHQQVPPATSAKRVDGERAYEKVRRGETVILPPTRVYLHEAGWLSHDLPRESRLKLIVRGGFYVRALARDLGRRLGCGAHLSALHRGAIGPWNDPGPGHSIAISGREILPWMPIRELTDDQVGQSRQGESIDRGDLIAPGWPLPEGFPNPAMIVRGFHLGRLRFLLKKSDDKSLTPAIELKGGL